MTPSWRPTASRSPAGANITVVAHLDEGGTPVLTPFVNDTSPIAAGQARLTVRHTAAAPAVDVRAGGDPVFTDLTNPDEASADIPAGTVSADVVLAGTDTVAIGPADVTLTEGVHTIVYAWGSAEDGNLALAVQTISGMHSSPGGVPGGTGGQAAGDGPAGLDARGRRAAGRRPDGRRHPDTPEAAGVVIGAGPTRRAVAIAVAALLGLLAAWQLAPRREPPGAAAGPQQQPAGSGAGAAAQPSTTAVRARPATPAAPPAASGVPVRVTIPALDLELPVLALGVDDQGLMALPDSAFSLAWYRFGPRPADPVGATVIAGHVDTVEEGIGPLARLGDLQPGDRIEVVTRRGTVRYDVTSVDRIAKSVLDLPALFSRAGRARLHLVTCGGDYVADRGGYQDNLVVTARRV